MTDEDKTFMRQGWPGVFGLVTVRLKAGRRRAEHSVYEGAARAGHGPMQFGERLQPNHRAGVPSTYVPLVAAGRSVE